ncbi:MAG: phosphoadenosine phosphosulfate reductase family protein [Candidatus Levybacteria bacterium]|nr:phosphoadenosine phosphosulfate reductase family protein [Candidatus Levybacteria bacterium]
MKLNKNKNKKMKKKLITSLSKKIAKSREKLNEAFKAHGEQMAIFWTGGKDSTVLLHLIREMFGAKAKFPVLFLDTGLDFEEVYNFIERTNRMWNLNLITIKPSKKLASEYKKQKTKRDRVTFASMMKIILLKQAVKEHKLPALVIGIRWDEHKERIDEKYFSKREDHIRIHPLLHWTEEDIWEYIHSKNVPYISLYDLGYRSLGEKEFTKPAKSGGDERSGRAKDREVIMKRLRALGYF